jgi:hypothetical protein
MLTVRYGFQSGGHQMHFICSGQHTYSWLFLDLHFICSGQHTYSWLFLDLHFICSGQHTYSWLFLDLGPTGRISYLVAIRDIILDLLMTRYKFYCDLMWALFNLVATRFCERCLELDIEVGILPLLQNWKHGETEQILLRMQEILTSL